MFCRCSSILLSEKMFSLQPSEFNWTRKKVTQQKISICFGKSAFYLSICLSNCKISCFFRIWTTWLPECQMSGPMNSFQWSIASLSFVSKVSHSPSHGFSTIVGELKIFTLIIWGRNFFFFWHRGTQ